MSWLKKYSQEIGNVKKEEDNKNGLFIIRGLPGSGKSTFAKEIISNVKNCTHYEADMFFVQDGQYNYDRNKIGSAHEWCLSKVKEDLMDGKTVIVSNTFTTLREMSPYIDFCKSNSIPFVVYRMTKNYGNIHNVPEEIVKKMNDRFQNYPGEVIK